MAIRLAHVNVASTYRGGERQTELLIRRLARPDMEQVLVASRGAPLSRRFGGTDVEVRQISTGSLTVLGAVRDVDLIHVHEGRSVYGAYLRHLVAGTPYIVTRRVDNPLRDNWFTHHAYRCAAFVATVAPQIADVVQTFDPAIRVRVVYSSCSDLSVDEIEAALIKSRLAGKFVVGHVGALDNNQKAQEHIIEVARSVVRFCPKLHFVLVGGGDDEDWLKQLARGLSNVTFTGFVENVGNYLAAFDLFVLPSRHEGVGSVLLDAMQYGLPVIATRVGGLPDIVVDGKNGILIDPERPDQLEAAVLYLAARPELRCEMGRCGEAAARQYTPDIMAEKYLELYDSALARHAMDMA